MTYHTDNKIRKYVQGYRFMSFAKIFGNKHSKKFLNKEISAFKRIKPTAAKFIQSKYGNMLKKEGTKVAGKQLSDKIFPAAADLAGSKIADKITSLKVSDKEEPQ